MWTINFGQIIKKKILFILSISFLSFSLYLLFSPVSYASTSETITREQKIMMLQDNLKSLKNDYDLVINLLNEQENYLTQAEEQAMISEQKISELKNTVIQLKESLNRSNDRIILLQNQLDEAKKSEETARISLEGLNQEFKIVSESYKNLQKKNNRIENQRNFWEILAAAAITVAIAK